MRWTRTAIIPIAAILALLAGVPAAPDGATNECAIVDQESFRRTIDAMRAEFVAAAASGDWSGAAGMLTPETVMVVPGGQQWTDIKAASELPYPPGTELRITPIEVRQLSRDWGYEFGTNQVEWMPEGAEAPVTLHDTYLLLFQHTEDGWKIYREVASSSLVMPLIPRPAINDA